MTSTLPSPTSLAFTEANSVSGIALALQVKVVLSSMLGGDRVRTLVSVPEPDGGEKVTRSVPLTSGVIPLNQLMETFIKSAKAESTVMLHINLRGALLPA